MSNFDHEQINKQDRLLIEEIKKPNLDLQTNDYTFYHEKEEVKRPSH